MPLPSTLSRGLVVAATLALLAGPASAVSLKQQNLTQLIADSQSIVSGKVAKVTDGVTPGGLPYTEVTIEVADAVKGNLRGGQKYTFRQFGLLAPRKLPDGRTLLAVTPEGFPQWSTGERVVAFLHRPAKRTGLQTTAGLAQGKLRMMDGRIANEFQNRGLFEGVRIESSLLSEKERRMLAAPAGAVDAATFIGLVGRAVDQRWVETGEMK